MGIMQYFPYQEARDIQEAALLELEASWEDYDIFCLVAPTATGKTAIAKTLMDWKYGVSVLTPNNMLIDQFVQEFPGTPKLKRMDLYYCDLWKQPCSKTRAKQKGFCKGCECSRDVAAATYRNGPGVYTYHNYVARKLHRKVLVMDEAHNLPRIISDMQARHIWQHDWKYPDNMYTREQICKWIDSLPIKRQQTRALTMLKEAVSAPIPRYVVKRDTDWFNGKGTRRGEPELRDCIKYYSLDPSPGVAQFMELPGTERGVEKLVLMSGTISSVDIRELGLDRKRVLQIHCNSPIPADSRPILPLNLINVNRHNLEQSCALMARFITEELLPEHKGEKGVIHVTYQMASILRNLLHDPRYLFHTREDKSAVYERFRAAPPESGRVLVACGMYEGIDLPEDLGRWQVIAKMPWKSLADPAIKWKADKDEEWYRWQCLKDFMQACGRICRTPKDYGATYILDSTFERLYNQSRHQIPQWFAEAIDWDARISEDFQK